ncbi:MAG: anaerobic ribonucleoside-triphosphate reductase activating protein [Thermodesulfobacteriota bacterium]
MVFGGLQKVSLIDYPGKICSVLFSRGCNFKCPYCHNPELVKETACFPFFEKTEVYDYLKRRKGLIEGVVLSGGEPTLHEDLLHHCLTIKHLGFSVKLDTNGSKPHVLETLLNNHAVDYVAMDIKTDPFDYGKITGNGKIGDQITMSIKLIMQSHIPYEFRTTCVKPFVSPDILKQIAEVISGADRYVLQRFHHETLLAPEFFKGQNPGFDDESMLQLKKIAALTVHQCVIV